MNQHINRRDFLALTGAAGLGATFFPALSYADFVPGPETRLVPSYTGEELAAQSDFWELELFFKPLRMIYVDVPGGASAADRKKRLVWYLCYRAVNRPIDRPAPDPGAVPLADKDPVERPPLFLPEFQLVTDDNNQQKSYIDRVIPRAQEVINRRERREDSRFVYKNSVEIIGNLPSVVPNDAKVKESDCLFGVAMWRSVDPTTDKFKIYMTGFSSGYKEEKTPDGKTIVRRKTIVQEFWRPSDEFDQDETEIRPVGPPTWIYR